MTKRDFLKTETLKYLSNKLNVYNFKLTKSEGEFREKTKTGMLNYFPVFLLQNEGWDVNPTLGIRINQVEDIFHRTSGFEAKYQKGTPTVGCSIDLLSGFSALHKFTLSDEVDINIVGDNLFTLFQKYALPFFKSYNNIYALDKLINDNLRDTNYTGSIFKGSKGLILARLTKRPNYEELVKIYTKYYEELSNGFYLPEFKALIKDLEENY